MPEPSIEILGVYHVPVTEELLREQFDILYGHLTTKEEKVEALQLCREQLKSVVLIELGINNLDDKFSLNDFTQAIPGQPPENWQAPYDEAYLSPDGEAVLSHDVKQEVYGELRIAFFLHDYNSQQPLLTSYGVLQCPTVQDMPERLQRLVPYEPVD
jgi:hypothetical protein